MKLHITRGEYTEEMLRAGFAGKMHKEALKQGEANRKAYAAKEGIYRVQIDKLTARIRNSILTHLDDQIVKSAAGKLRGDRIWRALYLDDNKIFEKKILGDTGNITVTSIASFILQRSLMWTVRSVSRSCLFRPMLWEQQTC